MTGEQAPDPGLEMTLMMETPEQTAALKVNVGIPVVWERICEIFRAQGKSGLLETFSRSPSGDSLSIEDSLSLIHI